jgi:hypothetical protein
MKHFKSTVPAAIQTKLAALANLAENEWESTLVTGHKGYDSLTDTRTDEIEGNYVSGWIPKQDGGYSVSRMYRNDCDSSYHFTEKQTDNANSQMETCQQMYVHDNKLESFDYDSMSQEEKEKYWDYENEWFSDGAVLQLQMFVEGFNHSDYWNNKNVPQVTIRLSINYKDAPYFREGYAEDIKQEILTVDEFLSMDNMSIIKHFTV